MGYLFQLNRLKTWQSRWVCSLPVLLLHPNGPCGDMLYDSSWSWAVPDSFSKRKALQMISTRRSEMLGYCSNDKFRGKHVLGCVRCSGGGRTRASYLRWNFLLLLLLLLETCRSWRHTLEEILLRRYTSLPSLAYAFRYVYNLYITGLKLAIVSLKWTAWRLLQGGQRFAWWPCTLCQQKPCSGIFADFNLQFPVEALQVKSWATPFVGGGV